MKTRIVLGAALVLTLGSAIGSTSLNVYAGAIEGASPAHSLDVAAAEVTPEVVAMWKATAASSDYTPPRLPI